MYQLIVYGISHKTAPVHIREQIALDVRSADPVTKFRDRKSINECVIISTCNRTEIYAVTDDHDSFIDDVQEYFISENGLNRKIIDDNFYSYSNAQAVRHLLRVSCSLDSMLIGEPQILGQVKESYNGSLQSGAAGIILHRLFQYAFSVAKRVRSDTNIGSLSVSVGYLAVKLSKRIFDDLDNRSVLLIGTGEIAELTARHLIRSGIKDLYIASRNHENAEILARRLHGTPVRFEDIYYKLTDVDIVVTATGSSDFIFKSEHVLQALRLRRNELMFFVDLAVPRNIDPRVNDISGVYLYDIDDLQSVLDQNINKREESAAEAERIVEEHASRFINWINGLKVVPTIIKLKDKMEDMKTRELERAYGKLGPLEQEQKKVIDNLADRIIAKVLHGPISGLKRESSTSVGMLYSETIQRLYGLDEKSEIPQSDEENINNWNQGK